MSDGWTKAAMVVLTVALVALKLSGGVTWSWVIVFAPLWLPAVISVGLRVATAAVLGAVAYVWLMGGSPEGLARTMEQVPLLQLLPWEKLL
jgi:hypothetical protein